MTPRDVGPEDLEHALDELPEPPEAGFPAEGSGVGIAKGRTFGSDAGRIHGSKTDPVLVGGVGYPYLADLALGTVLAHRLAETEPEGVAVADLSHTPIASVQTIAEGDHEALLLVGAEKRGGELNDGEPSEDPGRVRSYAPDDLPDLEREDATRLIGQGAMGLITVENVLQIGRLLDELPEPTRAITVEPAYDSWGMEVEAFSDPVEEVLDDLERRIEAWVEDQPNTSSSPTRL